ncbi:methyltransferase [Candidatus Woesebacteria bacterium RIFCSPHIGHO2_01_FULL_44_21]|uniref:Methyltransferase n=1 Tax=Candidatus Woesebacteria bacterium RIFCSPHIGHO2_01_FULL_44_21 TaxID=1802503 RepID=A0A1F7YW19_9BACT|nr:MAG: methyltransferase [Candidatus Woesebacteria bacterium RIFCSPHIGHO2_01_FULL_44_21]
MWFLYILLCRDNSYYTGITTNIKNRFTDHKEGKGGAYTRSHKPIKIIYRETLPSKSEALRREIQLKKWSRAKKEALVKRGM